MAALQYHRNICTYNVKEAFAEHITLTKHTAWRNEATPSAHGCPAQCRATPVTAEHADYAIFGISSGLACQCADPPMGHSRAHNSRQKQLCSLSDYNPRGLVQHQCL